MAITDGLQFLNRGNGTTFLDVENSDAAGSNVNTPVAVVGDDSEDGMTYNGTNNYTTMTALSGYSFLEAGWTLAVRATASVTPTANDAIISFGAASGNLWRLWLGFEGANTTRGRVRNGSLVNIDLTGTATIDSTERVYILRARDKLGDNDFSNGIVELMDSTGSVIDSGDYDLTTLTGYSKHTVGGDVTSSYGGGVAGDVFWSAGWNRDLSVAEIQSLDDSSYPFVSGPTISTITDPAITATALTIAGSGFGASQGSGGVTQEQGAISVALTETAWADTEITATSATIESTGLKYGVQTIEVTDDSAANGTNTYTATPLAGNDYVDLTSIATTGQLLTTSGVLAIGDQIRYANELSGGGGYSVTVNADATFSIDGATPDGVYTFEVRAWDTSDQTWGTASNQSVTVVAALVGSGDPTIGIRIGIGI